MTQLDRHSIAGLSFRAERHYGRFGHPYWMAYCEDRGVLIPNISKPTRRQLWDDLENDARACGNERFVSDILAIGQNEVKS